jgi:hypothetical protein
VVATEKDYGQYGQEYEQEQDNETMWASQETKDTWVKVAEDADADRQTARWERRQSHLSDKHMNLGPMRLLSDETPPDVMEGSWDLDSIDDDHAKELHTNDLTTTTTTTTRFNEQNDRNITKNNDNAPPFNNTTVNNNNDKHNTSAHGYAHMGKEEKSAIAANGRSSRQLQRPGRQTISPNPPRPRSTAHDAEDEAKDGQSDGDHNSSSSFVSTYIRKSPTSVRTVSQIDNANRPWRDSKLRGIFMDLLDEQTQHEQLADHGPIAVQPQSAEDKEHALDVSGGDFGDIHEVLHNDYDLSNHGAVRTPSRQAKYEKAKQSIAALSPSRDLQDSPEETPSPASDSAASLLFKRTQEAFLKQKRQAIIKAAMTLDPHDDRSLLPKADKNLLSIKTAIAPSRTSSNIPPSSRSSRVSYGSRHRSQVRTFQIEEYRHVLAY